MNRKKIARLLLISLIFIIFSGCWSRKEIETLAFVTMLGVDKEGSDLLVTAQIALPESGGENGGGANEPGVWNVIGRGKTIGEAHHDLTRFVGRQIFLSHVRAIIIGEELAKAGITEIIDYFNRHWQFRGTHWVAVAKGKANDIMQVESKLTTMPALYINDMFVNADETSLAPKVTFLDFVRQMVSTAKCQPYAPVLHLFNVEKGRKNEFTQQPLQEGMGQQESEGEDSGTGQNGAPAEALSLEQVAVFKGDRLVGWLNEEETRGLLWIQGKVSRGTMVLKDTFFGSGTITLLSTFARSKVVVKPKGESVKIDIFISQEGNLLEQTVGVDFSAPENTEVLNQRVAALIKRETEAVLFKLQKQLNSDIAGIGIAVREQQPEIWANLNWEEEFSDVEINIHVAANLRRTGEIIWPGYKEKPWKAKTMPKNW